MNKCRVAVISDIHGNYEALSAVLKDIKKKKVSKVICLGDVIGYGVDSEKCFKRLLQIDDIEIIRGNHEDMYLDVISDKKCSSMGKQSNKFTKLNIIDPIIDGVIRELPYSLIRGNIKFIHANNPANKNFEYIYNEDTIKKHFEFEDNINIYFYGHTHRPQIHICKTDAISSQNIKGNEEFLLSTKDNYLINTGSVGQSRDGSTKASYVILEIMKESVKVQFVRVSYNYLKAFFKIANSELGLEVATFLIQEKQRRKVYEYIYNWWQWIYRKKFNK